jgi:glycosyltransferase involved in cell wall biosynthesis
MARDDVIIGGWQEAPPEPHPDDVISSGVTTLDGARHPRVAVVIPAYNEGRFVGSVVLKASRYADVVVVVDDGSTDDTAEVAAAAGAIVVRHASNQGKGVALNTGFRRASEYRPEVIVTLDADGQHFPEEMDLVIQPVLQDRADIVVGSRYLQNGSRVPPHRIWGHRFFNFISNSVSGVEVTDSQSGFRAFSPRAISRISFNSSGFSVESEMQLLAREHHLRVDEVPITIQYLDKPKRSVLSQGLTVLSGILRLTGQYRPLLFFGVTGLILLLAGLMLGMWVVEIYRTYQTLPVGYTLLASLLTILAALSLFTGIILHSMRGLLLDLVQPRH